MNSPPSAEAPAPIVESPIEPSEVIDPSIFWQLKREQWLNSRPSSSSSSRREGIDKEEGGKKRVRGSTDNEIGLRLTSLENMLTKSISISMEGLLPESGGKLSKLEKGKSIAVDQPEPDGGFPIRERPERSNELDKLNLERIGEGILSAFRMSRTLKEPIPLSLVTKLLYSTWLTDGTIPPQYSSSSNSSGLPFPMPARTISGLSQGPGITSPSSSTSIPSTSGIKINHLAESRWRSELDVEDTQDVI